MMVSGVGRKGIEVHTNCHFQYNRNISSKIQYHLQTFCYVYFTCLPLSIHAYHIFLLEILYNIDLHNLIKILENTQRFLLPWQQRH